MAKGDFISSIGDFFGDVAKGAGVAASDVVHAVGPLLSTVGAGLLVDVSANVIPAIKAYLVAGGALNVGGIVAVGVSALVTGAFALAAKSPNNVIATVASAVPVSEVQTIANSAASAAQSAVTKLVVKP